MYPPVDTTFFHAAAAPAESHFLIVSALVPYKRIDLAIDACRRAGARLRIVGDGPDRERLQRQANAAPAGDGGVEFLGHVSDEEIRREYWRARAVILPGTEDFGIVPVEAQACGRPVVAFAAGGALETVLEGETGTLFESSDSTSLAAALERTAATRFDAERISRHAQQFSRERHVRALQAVVADTIAAPAGTRW